MLSLAISGPHSQTYSGKNVLTPDVIHRTVVVYHVWGNDRADALPAVNRRGIADTSHSPCVLDLRTTYAIHGGLWDHLLVYRNMLLVDMHYGLIVPYIAYCSAASLSNDNMNVVSTIRNLYTLVPCYPCKLGPDSYRLVTSLITRP